ncbi:hypothetical protein AMBR_CKHPCMOK_01084 [Lacticaseibacillus rhamnosus]|nr:hypothetical protein AMBR_CKHPCMOK_01084 [Lacticaseibacillus rhamnosus]
MRADTEDSGLVSQLKANAIWLLPLLAIILVLLVQWPQLHLTYIFHQDDTMPQLRRMESYVTSVRHGSYFPKVFPEEVRNFGYAFDAFYRHCCYYHMSGCDWQGWGLSVLITAIRR